MLVFQALDQHTKSSLYYSAVASASLNDFSSFNSLFKVLSSFPRGTCSLSVSRQYLALEGVYLPFRAAFPNNPTLESAS